MNTIERAAIEKFLEILQRTWRGRAITVNILDSSRLPSVDHAWMKEFLLECAETLEHQRNNNSANANSENAGQYVIEDVAEGHGTRRRVHLRRCRQQALPEDGACELANSMSARSFYMFMLNEKYKDSLQDVPTILPLTPTSTPRRAEEYRGNLVDVMSNPDWHKPDAVIGRPLQSPANCWLTSGQFKPLSDGPRYETDLATQTRDELGLVNLVKGQLLLRLTISAGCLAAIEGNESARPIFCDGGNSRFRVHDPSEPAAVYATDGWGATFHLGKFAVGATDNMTGRSERVFTSLPLEHLPALKVELLGEIGETPERPANCKDDDEEFFKALLAGRTESDINERLTEFLREL